jgi:hypothetical protein
LSLLTGDSNSGKTEQALDLAKRACDQRRGVLYIDADATLEVARLRRQFIAEQYFWWMRPQCPAQAFAAALAFCQRAPESLLIIDSLDGLLPEFVERRRFLRRSLPRLIGGAYANRCQLLFSSLPQRGALPLLCRAYSSHQLNLNETTRSRRRP